MECNHDELKRMTVEKTFKGEIFTTTGDVCVKCGSEIWTNQMSSDFHEWLKDLKFDNTVQYTISNSAHGLFEGFMKLIHCNDYSKFIRAVIAVMNERLSDSECNAVFSEIMELDDYKKLESEPASVSKKVRITNAKTYYDFTVWCDVMGMSESEMIRTYLLLMLIMTKNTNQKFADFWNSYFKQYIDFILAA
jgi:hypothetical protein